jgi:hypothetical protein
MNFLTDSGRSNKNLLDRPLIHALSDPSNTDFRHPTSDLRPLPHDLARHRLLLPETGATGQPYRSAPLLQSEKGPGDEVKLNQSHHHTPVPCNFLPVTVQAFPYLLSHTTTPAPFCFAPAGANPSRKPMQVGRRPFRRRSEN